MKSVTRHAPTAARILLGLVFFVFGLNGFLRFIPEPPGMPERVMTFMNGLMAAGYLFPLIKGVEVLVGVLLLANRFVPLALALIAPNIVNIVLFHAFLAPSGLPIALVVLALELFLAWSYRDAYAPMLRARVRPSAESGHAESVHAGAPA
ncbi:MAG: DoxX family membrane protein [Myxococcales bacterium]|nr:DoxX family membrane protein [Myxococcales bacterium]